LDCAAVSPARIPVTGVPIAGKADSALVTGA
jgi:hypothetical protein